jgi:FkbM family methyltransferase
MWNLKKINNNTNIQNLKNEYIKNYKKQIIKQLGITIKNEKNNTINTLETELEEQYLAYRLISKDDIVFELGARYGSVSCIINKRLTNKYNQVVVEPDSRVWNALEINKNNNNCEFNIVKGFVSNKKLSLTNLDSGYGVSSVENINSNIPSYTLNEIKNTYNIDYFNVLVADCEGFLETFLNENTDILFKLRLIIFEADYPENCNYNNVKNMLVKFGFKKVLEGHQNVWIK